MIDDRTADSLLAMLRMSQTADLDCRAEMAMWRAASEFTAKTGENEFAFFERAARAFVGTAFTLYPEAARRYLGAVIDAFTPEATPEMRRFALRNAALAVGELHEALKRAGAEPAGRG
jgi:hypothetical protein